MNTPLLTIVTDGYRESNITNINSVLTDAQKDEGIRLLNQVIASVYGNEAGENFQSMPQGQNDVVSPGGYPPQMPENFYFPLNVRVPLNLTEPRTFLLHPNPQDGSRFAVVDENSTVLDVTINANGRRIEGASTYVFTDTGSYREWFFDARSGIWNVVTPLTIDDVLPFPTEFDSLFTIRLALRLNPRYTVAMSAESATELKDNTRKFKARYSQIIQVRSEDALLFTPGTRWQRGYGYWYGYGNTTDEFNRGTPFYW